MQNQIQGTQEKGGPIPEQASRKFWPVTMETRPMASFQNALVTMVRRISHSRAPP